jgi:hypothetical protein
VRWENSVWCFRNSAFKRSGATQSRTPGLRGRLGRLAGLIFLAQLLDFSKKLSKPPGLILFRPLGENPVGASGTQSSPCVSHSSPHRGLLGVPVHPVTSLKKSPQPDRAESGRSPRSQGCDCLLNPAMQKAGVQDRTQRFHWAAPPCPRGTPTSGLAGQGSLWRQGQGTAVWKAVIPKQGTPASLWRPRPQPSSVSLPG